MTSSLAQLIGSGQNVACNFEKSDASGSQSGTVYVSQDKMYGDFNIVESNGTSTMHMIHDGQWSYMWGGPMEEGQGMKVKIDARRAGAGNGQGPDMEKEMNFNCQPWSVDAAKFEPPTNVQFMELGGGAQGAGVPDMKQLQCAACDEVPEGPERQQCQQALGCA